MKYCAPPDANPRKPAFVAPPGSCDAHCHVFGPADRFPYSPGRKYTPPDAPREALKRLHDFLGIDRAVLVQASCHGTDNSAMLDAIATSGGAYKGVCIADGSFSPSDFQHLHEGGVRGVRFNFVRHLGGAPDLDMVGRVVDRVTGLGWHLVVHVNAEDLVEYESFFAAFSLPVVIDHMARVAVADGIDQPAFRILLEFMKRENMWVKICGAERISAAGAPYHDAAPFAQALVDSAPDRVIWGTDWPHPNVKAMPNDGDLVDLLPLVLRDEVRQKKVLVDNPARLYGFDGE